MLDVQLKTVNTREFPSQLVERWRGEEVRGRFPKEEGTRNCCSPSVGEARNLFVGRFAQPSAPNS